MESPPHQTMSSTPDGQSMPSRPVHDLSPVHFNAVTEGLAISYKVPDISQEVPAILLDLTETEVFVLHGEHMDISDDDAETFPIMEVSSEVFFFICN